MLEKDICPYFCLTPRHYLKFITLEIYHSSMYLSMLLVAKYPPASPHLPPEDTWEPPDPSVAYSLL